MVKKGNNDMVLPKYTVVRKQANAMHYKTYVKKHNRLKGQRPKSANLDEANSCNAQHLTKKIHKCSANS